MFQDLHNGMQSEKKRDWDQFQGIKFSKIKNCLINNFHFCMEKEREKTGKKTNEIKKREK